MEILEAQLETAGVEKVIKGLPWCCGRRRQNANYRLKRKFYKS